MAGYSILRQLFELNWKMRDFLRAEDLEWRLKDKLRDNCSKMLFRSILSERRSWRVENVT